MADIRTKIKNTILEFITDLHSIAPDEMLTDLELVRLFFNTMPPFQLSEHVVKSIVPHKNEIKNRDINFFMNNRKQIFQGIPEKHLEFLTIFITQDMSKEDRDTVWAYFDVLVALAEKL